ncbi:MAG: hypothetical protein QXE01_11915 [Sulfolobales archaeon]
MERSPIEIKGYSSPPNVFDGGEGENTQMPLDTLKVCLKKLPYYYVWGKGLEWTDYFYKCKIFVGAEKDEVYAINQLFIVINVKSDKLFEVINKAKELLKTEIKKRGGIVYE